MNKYWSPSIRSLTPYVPGEQPKENNLIKLNTNENPYSPSPKVNAAIEDCLNINKLNLYSDPNSTNLKNAIANYFKVSHNEVFVGNGSDEVLAHIFKALFKHTSPILFPDISYGFYPVYCKLFDINYTTVPLDIDYKIIVEDYNVNNGGIIFPNPNAPTGSLLTLKSIKAILQDNPESVVVIDEAYIDFGGESAICLVKDHPNLLVVQTFSKSRSLAGLRIGYAIGQKHLIEGLEKVKNSFNSYPINSISSVAAIASLQDDRYFQQQCHKIIQQRNKVVRSLNALNFYTLSSSANFIFTQPPEPYSALAVSKFLRKKSIIVRHFTKDRIDTFLRITIGTESENKILLQRLKEFI